MIRQKKLDATGKGEFHYDYHNDILTFKIRDRDYKTSVEMQNFVIDIDKEDFVTGVRIFDVSSVTGLKKIVFRDLVLGDFSATISDNVITARLHFVGRIRNRILPIFSSEKNFTQQITAAANPKYGLEDSFVSVKEIVAG
jgi:hypothetical protein